MAKMSQAQGWEAGPGVLGRVMGEIRRGFSVTVVRGAAMCLLDRLAPFAPGARAAAERRQLTLRLEERRRHESEAHLNKTFIHFFCTFFINILFLHTYLKYFCHQFTFF